MNKYYLAFLFFMCFEVTAAAQLAHPVATGQDADALIESVNRNIRAKKANALRKLEEDRRIAEQEKSQAEQEQHRLTNAKQDFAIERETTEAAISAIPDTRERIRQMARFRCQYPRYAALPPQPLEVENCIAKLDLDQYREIAMRHAAVEQRRKEEERKAEEDRVVDIEQKAEAERKAQATEDAARKANLAKEHRVNSFVFLLGLVVIVAFCIRKRRHGLASLAAALPMGFLSAFLISLLVARVSMMLFLVSLFSGWILSMHILLSRTNSGLRVLSRGFLLGTVEWLAMIPVGIIYAGKSATETIMDAGVGGSEVANMIVGNSLFEFFSGMPSIFMVAVCLIGYAINYFVTREMKLNEGATMNCPECAETINAVARKCWHCGAVLVTLASQ